MNSNKSIDKKSKSTKHITVYLNGLRTEKYKLTLDPKRYSKWYHVLNDITYKINPYFGVVKKLYSSESGVTINSFSDLENNGTYVVSDNRKFKILQGGYNFEEKKNYFEHYLTGQLNRNNKIKKLTHVRCDLMVIYVYNNGKERNPPEKIVLSKEDLQNWDQTLSFIALIIDMPCRTVRALYDSHGNKICGAWELQHGASYIAVGYHEKFIPRNYKIRENTVEIWKDGIPVVHQNKNVQCLHKSLHKHIAQKNWKQNLEWKHLMEDLYDYSPMQSNKKAITAKSGNSSPKWNEKPDKNICSCNSCSSSKSKIINYSSIFFMPSDNCGCYRNCNSKLTNPPNNSYEIQSKQYERKKIYPYCNILNYR